MFAKYISVNVNDVDFQENELDNCVRESPED